MIRQIVPDDTATVIALVVRSGLFPEGETGVLVSMLADYFGGRNNAGHICLIDEEAELRGVAYAAPEPVTSGTYNLLLIAVRSDYKGRGCGTALLEHVEAVLRADGHRLLLAETSGLQEFARTRAFYLKCGYEEEARIQDYYDAGEDMVLFRKNLRPG